MLTLFFLSLGLGDDLRFWLALCVGVTESKRSRKRREARLFSFVGQVPISELLDIPASPRPDYPALTHITPLSLPLSLVTG